MMVGQRSFGWISFIVMVENFMMKKEKKRVKDLRRRKSERVLKRRRK